MGGGGLPAGKGAIGYPRGAIVGGLLLGNGPFFWGLLLACVNLWGLLLSNMVGVTVSKYHNLGGV